MLNLSLLSHWAFWPDCTCTCSSVFPLDSILFLVDLQDSDLMSVVTQQLLILSPVVIAHLSLRSKYLFFIKFLFIGEKLCL